MASLERAQTLDYESLFSLEVVVDSLSLPNVTCRFPSIAFRLLDFPTLLMYHVEPDLAESIRQKILSDPYYKLPQQLPELKDRHDNFVVKKGKSTLFRVSANMLMDYLSSTPLYVMLIDTYPEVPKLIGNCTIPLDNIMGQLFDNITSMGLSVPAVHGEKGKYQVFNLMGTHIGTIEMGYRLMSLGMGLISHIPEKNIAKVRQNREIDLVGDALKAKQTADVVLHDLETADKPTQVDMSFPASTRASQTEADKPQTKSSLSATTQTRSQKKKKTKTAVQAAPSLLPDNIQFQDDDFFVSNTVCPPPLFFNSEAESAEVGLMRQIKFLGDEPEQSDNGKTSEYESDGDSTIREEDGCSDSDLEDFYAYRIPKIPPTQPGIKRKVANKPKPMVSWNKPAVAATKAAPLPNFGNLPILNALVKEIMALQGVPLPDEHKAPGKKIVETPPSPKASKIIEHKSLSESPVVHQETREEFMNRMSSPVRRMSSPPPCQHGRQSHKTCLTGDIGVPKNKGWLRQTPQYGVRKTKLMAGMTNTQRLRLAKSNPTLLRQLEREEREARFGRPQATPRMDRGTRILEHPVDVSTEISHHMELEDSMDLRLPLEKLDLKYDKKTKQKRQAFAGLKDTMELKKRPVPTPRLSLSFREASLDQSDLPQALQEENGYSSHSDRASRSKSIEVHVPSHSVGVDDGDDTDATVSQQSDFENDIESQKAFGQTRTIANPGFPMESVDSQAYSEDFEKSHTTGVDALGEEPGLRMVMDKYSDTSSQSGEEPSLRRVVDHYSTASEQDASEQSKKSRSRSNSYHSVYSQVSKKSEELKKKLANEPTPKPTVSDMSPIGAYKGASMDTRQPLDDQNDEKSESPGRPRSPRKPRVTPRKLERSISVRTESVSSYAPSEGDDIDLSELQDLEERDEDDYYSDSFDDPSDDSIRNQNIGNIKVSAQAKLGYTWT